MIEVKNLYKSFEGKEVLKNINAVFENGKTNLIIGQSGSGKTVLVKNLVGLLEPTQGEVLYDGRNFVKMTKKYGEEAKVAVRNLRRDVNDELKKAEKAGELTEDDLKKELEDTQKTIEKAIKDIDAIIGDKEKELMEV